MKVGRDIIHWPTVALVGILVIVACEEPVDDGINSVLLAGGAYARITNRQDLAQPLDTTTLAILNRGVFSLEIRAAGDTLPVGVAVSATMFMIGNDQERKFGVYREPLDSSRIQVYFESRQVGNYTIPGCDWNDPDVFTQIVVTYDGATVSVYGNGRFMGSLSDTTGIDVVDSDALIGADWDVSNDVSSLGNFWYGAIDEVRLWTRVLPDDEMMFRYRNPKNLTRNYSNTGLDPLLGLWRFNVEQFDADTVLDASGKGNDATLHQGNGTIEFSKDGA